jgi:hypothetical protein
MVEASDGVSWGGGSVAFGADPSALAILDMRLAGSVIMVSLGQSSGFAGSSPYEDDPAAWLGCSTLFFNNRTFVMSSRSLLRHVRRCLLMSMIWEDVASLQV